MTLRRAQRLYRRFREAPPRAVKKVSFKMPKALMMMGTVDAIEYTTTHGAAHRKKTVLYRHDFAPGSKPVLAAGTVEGQLYLIGGRFKVTARGIVDLTSHRRQILD